MSILKNSLKSNYSQIPNEMITDENLCNGSLRVLLYLFTKPDNWKVYNSDICKNVRISEQTLTKYWKILLKSGWLQREKAQDKKGNFMGGYNYQIGTKPISIQSTEQVKSIDYINIKEYSNTKTILNTKEKNKKENFTFNLKAVSFFENLNTEYENRLKEEIENLKLSLSFEDFRDSCLAKGYKYKNFLLAYKKWAKNPKSSNTPQKQFKSRQEINNDNVDRHIKNMRKRELEASKSDYEDNIIDVEVEKDIF